MAGLAGVTGLRPGLPEQAEAQSSAAKQMVETAARSLPGGIRLRIFQPTGRVYAEVVDPTTREVVKTVPPMEMLKVMARLHQTVGLLVDREG